MIKGINYIEVEKLEEVAKATGLKWEPQAGFIRVGNKGRALYIAKTKKVGRVDVSGFLPKEGPASEGLKVLTQGERFCRVFAQIDFTRAEEDILHTFKECIEHMKALAPETEEEKKERQNARRRFNKPSAPPLSGGKPRPTNAEVLAMTLKYAAERGLQVSPKAYERYSQPDPAPEAVA